MGFLVGSLLARRYRRRTSAIVGISLALTALAQLVVWRLGVAALGLDLTLFLTLIFAFLLALSSGFLVVRLMEDAHDATAVIIADSIGSVLGAVTGGFFLVPLLGLNASFLLIFTLQAAGLMAALIMEGMRPGLVTGSSCLLGVSLLIAGSFSIKLRAERNIVVDGLPLAGLLDEAELVFERRSPFGVLSVVNEGGARTLRIDNRGLCAVGEEYRSFDGWRVGEVPVQLAQTGDGAPSSPRVAIVGLGCGVTLAAVLEGLPEGPAHVDMIEINPEMPKAQALFEGMLGKGLQDPRVDHIVRDGFAHFADLPENVLYDAVVIDVAWMQNMNATHLFSAEMYENIRRHLSLRGVIAVWSEETIPYSPVALIQYKTLKSVFAHVAVEVHSGYVLFYAAQEMVPGWENVISGGEPNLQAWMEALSRDVSVNRLDNLVMNRHKFTVLGDSNFDRLREKYSAH